MVKKNKRQRQDDEPAPVRMGENDIDLSWYLSVLDRSQLEMLCVQMIIKNSFDFSVLEAATANIDFAALIESIDDALADSAESSYFFSKALYPMVERAGMYCKINRINNALGMLIAITSAFATCVCEDENLPEETEGEEASEREELNSFVAHLESAWEIVVTKFSPAVASTVKNASDKNVIDYAEVKIPTTHKDLFAMLAEWRTALTPIFGPLFSDALRISKKAIMKEEKKTSGDGEAEIPSSKQPASKIPRKK